MILYSLELKVNCQKKVEKTVSDQKGGANGWDNFYRSYSIFHINASISIPVKSEFTVRNRLIRVYKKLS